MRLLPAAIALGLWLASPARADETLVLEGQAPEDGARFFDVPFTVPPGIAELQVHHESLNGGNILDWGLEDPRGFRGYGGGNTEDAIVGERAASRSYLPGPLPAGTWKVTVGLAKIVSGPARYRVEISLRTRPTLPPQPERRPYVTAAPLTTGRRWYAGDFHVHSRESGDAKPSLDEIAAFARSRGLDFALLSDHNTTATLDFIGDAQARHGDFLFIPGVEFTTYRGHANALGAMRRVDPRIGYGDRTLDAAVRDFHSQGALFSINHPAFDLAARCIGCGWEHALPEGGVDAVEIATGGLDEMGFMFSDDALAFWDGLCARGVHAAALGGSDDHRAGQETSRFSSPIGNPTTLVLADALSVPAVLEAVKAGRTVVKLRGPGDPMVELSATGERRGDTVVASGAHLTARVTGGLGARVRWVRNGEPLPAVNVTSDPFEVQADATAPERGEERWRAEVLVDDRPRTVTSHVWLTRAAGRPADGGPAPAGGSHGATALAWVGLLGGGVLVELWWRGRARRSPRDV